MKVEAERGEEPKNQVLGKNTTLSTEEEMVLRSPFTSKNQDLEGVHENNLKVLQSIQLTTTTISQVLIGPNLIVPLLQKKLSLLMTMWTTPL